MSSTNARLHEVVEQLPDVAAGELLEYADWLRREQDDPLTDDERERVEAGEAESARGALVTLDAPHRHRYVPASEAQALACAVFQPSAG